MSAPQFTQVETLLAIELHRVGVTAIRSERERRGARVLPMPPTWDSLEPEQKAGVCAIARYVLENFAPEKAGGS